MLGAHPVGAVGYVVAAAPALQMPVQRVLCRQWAMHGKCAQGANCPFAHGSGAEPSPHSGEAAGPTTTTAATTAADRRPSVAALEDEVPPPGLEPGGYEEAGSPSLEWFERPSGYETRYRAQAERELDPYPALVSKAKPQPQWRKVENAGAVYWYNETTGVSQWEAPPGFDVAQGARGAAAPDDFEGLVRAAEGQETICEALGDGVVLRVIVKPGQAEDNVLDVSTACVQVSLRAPIEDRWCNQGLLAFCRRALHVPQRERNAVKITDGEDSLDKLVYIPALSVKDVVKRLHKKKDFHVDAGDVDKWLRYTERKQKEEERRLKRRKWA